MVAAALDTLDGLEPSSIEIDRGGDSYSVDTVETIRAEEPDAEILLVMGSDVAPKLESWHRHEDLRDMVTLAIVDRPGSVAARPPEGWRWELAEAPLIDLSSTELRQRMVDDRPVRFLVPDPSLAPYFAWWQANHGIEDNQDH